MTTTIRSKADIEMHRDGWYSDPLPAINVKVRKYVSDADCALVVQHAGDEPAPDFTAEWMEERDEEGEWWWIAAEHLRETIQEDALNLWGPRSGVEIEFHGRQGGWAVVSGLPDVEEWDAIALGRWRTFNKWVGQIVADHPYMHADLMYHNVWLPEQERKARAAAAYAEDLTWGTPLFVAA